MHHNNITFRLGAVQWTHCWVDGAAWWICRYLQEMQPWKPATDEIPDIKWPKCEMTPKCSNSKADDGLALSVLGSGSAQIGSLPDECEQTAGEVRALRRCQPSRISLLHCAFMQQSPMQYFHSALLIFISLPFTWVTLEESPLSSLLIYCTLNRTGVSG